MEKNIIYSISILKKLNDYKKKSTRIKIIFFEAKKMIR